ncbi:hypothetical protein [Streptomyces sp. NBC_01462]|uniref:hypothetical protein n=1 Tax=Streptomyces sp. NBC_01462 TaxID=2903876 RepID=UPI002E37DD75|nr:hypothetical protein [Streptomyces sp. NBC_01462]
MNCGSTGSPVLDLVKGFFDFLGDPVGTIVELIGKLILAGAIAVFGALTTGVPTLTGTTTAKNVNGQTQWLVVYLAVGSLLFAAARMAVERRGNAGATALKGMLRVIVVSGGATTIVTAAAAVADNYSTHLFNAGALDVLAKVGCSDGSGVEGFLLLFLAFLLLIAGIIQTVLMYIRLGVMILLLGTLPLAAAASMTDWGGGWWRKHIGWMIAWLLYKPAAGLVLYAGSEMIVSSETSNQGGNAVNERIAGIGVMLLSAVALPALLKLVVPATAALGGASAYGSGGQAVGGALASGARSLGGSGGSGTRGGTGPSGASSASGGSGGSGSSGANGSNGSGGPSGGGRTGGTGASGGAGAGRAAAAGPAGVAVAAAVTAAQVLGRTASGSLDGADGDQGHNPSHGSHR